MGQLLYLPDVVTLELDAERCNGCAMCIVVCPHAVFEMADKRAHIAKRDACMECGACQLNCSEEAISVEAGVGCAAAIINGLLGRESSNCCCVVDPDGKQKANQTGSCNC